MWPRGLRNAGRGLGVPRFPGRTGRGTLAPRPGTPQSHERPRRVPCGVRGRRTDRNGGRVARGLPPPRPPTDPAGDVGRGALVRRLRPPPERDRRVDIRPSPPLSGAADRRVPIAHLYPYQSRTPRFFRGAARGRPGARSPRLSGAGDRRSRSFKPNARPRDRGQGDGGRRVRDGGAGVKRSRPPGRRNGRNGGGRRI